MAGGGKGARLFSDRKRPETIDASTSTGPGKKREAEERMRIRIMETEPRNGAEPTLPRSEVEEAALLADVLVAP